MGAEEDRAPFWFPPQAGRPDAPAGYLRYLADCLCYALARCETPERAQWWAIFRKRADAIGIAEVECRGITLEDEVRSVLDPGNRAALDWSRACIERGLAGPAQDSDPGKVIARLHRIG